MVTTSMINDADDTMFISLVVLALYAGDLGSKVGQYLRFAIEMQKIPS